MWLHVICVSEPTSRCIPYEAQTTALHVPNMTSHSLLLRMSAGTISQPFKTSTLKNNSLLFTTRHKSSPTFFFFLTHTQDKHLFDELIFRAVCCVVLSFRNPDYTALSM